MPQALVLAHLLAVSPKDVAQARRLIHESMKAYDVAQFDRALADAVAAYGLDPLPAILFNLGQCERALRHWDKAAFFFRRYLSAAPNARNWRVATQLLAEAEARSEVAPSPAPPPHLA